MKRAGLGRARVALPVALRAAVWLLASSVPIGAADARDDARSVIVSVVTDPRPGPGAEHGLRSLLRALEEKGTPAERVTQLAAAKGRVLVVAGLPRGGGALAGLLGRIGSRLPEGPESLLVQRTKAAGKPAVLVAGSDDRGVMYATLDVADRIRWAADPERPLSEVIDAREKPAVVERALSIYTMHRGHFESRFHDERYWDRYLDLVARSRFNTFVLIFGYENWGYFAPPYPYFFDVAGFPDVRVVGITAAEQQRNLRALNRLIDQVHARGLRFTVGIWDHLYRGGVQGPREFTRQPTAGLVWGLGGDNLVPYTLAALPEFLRRVPGIDGIQFRMHGESGLKRGEMHSFWENVYGIVKETRGDLRFDARAKNFPDTLIQRAIDMGVPIRICTKYWAEQMGLPFHPTHINRQNQFDRRHGYADLLRYPRRYKMHWRMWTGGTTRILLWGDPEYVRRFAASTHLYGGEGYEVNEPLATKMQDQPHEDPTFSLLAPRYRYYDWEFERYWHFFQVFGRLGYNPRTPEQVWRREFEARFGKDAGPLVERALHRASRILPRIVATCFPYRRFPTTRGWVEKQRREDLPEYAKAEGSDTQQFLSIDEAARLLVAGEDSPKLWPQANSLWYARTAENVLELVGQAEERVGRHRSKEFESTLVDLKILAHLARYHARRIHAGLGWSLHQHAGDLHALDSAIRHEASAIEAWEDIVEAAGDVYAPDLRMGRRSAGLSGHWKDELVALRRGLEKLREERNAFRPEEDAAGPVIGHAPVRRLAPGEDLVIRATVSGSRPIQRVRVVYRDAEGGSGEARLEAAGPYLYRATIPASRLGPGLAYTVEATDAAGSRTTWRDAPIRVSISKDREPPTLRHTPVRRHPAGKPLTVRARVDDASGVRWVRLRYRPVNQHFDYKRRDMLQDSARAGEYAATLPASEIDPTWDFMYFIEVMDREGNGRIYPDFERETPYVVVELDR